MQGLRFKKHLIHELDYAKDVINLDAKKLSSKLNEDILTEWMNVEDNVHTVHHYTDSEIVVMVENPEKNDCTDNDKDESSDENKEDVGERIFIDKLNAFSNELLVELVQRSFISEQDIMNVYLLQDRLIQERSKFIK